MNQQRIEIDVLLTLQDYLRMNYWFLFKKFKLMLSVLLFVGGIAPIFYILSDLPKNPNDSYWGFAIPWVILIFLFVGTYIGSKRQLASNKSLNEKQHLIFSAEGIKSAGVSSSWESSWENIREAFETKSNFLLFIAMNQVQIIPKRCFQNDDQIVLFRNMLKTQLDSRAKIK
jgi:hypothetical protein